MKFDVPGLSAGIASTDRDGGRHHSGL